MTSDLVIYLDLFMVSFIGALAWAAAFGLVWLVARAIDRSRGR